MTKIGIDAVAIAVPEGYLDLQDLAEARGVPPAKYVEGLGVRQMAVARAHEDPRLVALEVGVSGSYTKEVNDFWRPLHSKEAYVDGHLSVQCYLDAISGAYSSWKAAGASPEPIARRLYHVPYGKMARKAHR